MSTNSETIDYSFWKVLNESARQEDKFVLQGDTVRMGNNLLQVVRNKNNKPKDMEEEKSETQSATRSEKSNACFSQLDGGFIHNRCPLEGCQSPRYAQEEDPFFPRLRTEKRSPRPSEEKALPEKNMMVCSIIKKAPCRICFDETCSDEDPIISPCVCSGSISGIHLKCLKQWLDVKTIVKKKAKPHVTTWDLTKFKCEVCNSFIPGTLPFKGPFNKS